MTAMVDYALHYAWSFEHALTGGSVCYRTPRRVAIWNPQLDLRTSRASSAKPYPGSRRKPCQTAETRWTRRPAILSHLRICHSKVVGLGALSRALFHPPQFCYGGRVSAVIAPLRFLCTRSDRLDTTKRPRQHNESDSPSVYMREESF